MIIERTIKVCMFMLAAFISIFSIGASTVIFWRSIEIVQSFGYTKWQEYGIVICIGFVLTWLCTLSASSAESIIINQLKKSKEKKNE